MTVPNIDQHDAERFVQWLLSAILADARGDRVSTMPVAPTGRLWLGRLAPEDAVRNSPLGQRGERLEPCAIGVRVRPSALDERVLSCTARIVAWQEVPGATGPGAVRWRKSRRVEVSADLSLPPGVGSRTVAGREDFAAAFRSIGAEGLCCEFSAEIELGKDGPELVVTIVNVSPMQLGGWDTTLYEVELRVAVGETQDFTLDDLPDSFRYDRRVAAYGINGGVENLSPGVFRTTDVVARAQPRPDYWDPGVAGQPPDLRFTALTESPLTHLRALVEAAERWGNQMWSDGILNERALNERWDRPMREEAGREAAAYGTEVERLRAGLRLLEEDPRLQRAFCLANRTFAKTPAVRYQAWRAFQLGFVLSNLSAIAGTSAEAESQLVDTLWFATGGGKTETYLLLVVTAAFYDRLRGKRSGITSWARFPLRMLSLQQTQRFADVLAAAELVRRAEGIVGDVFSIGFFVGSNGTPNRISPDPGAGEPDPADPEMPARYRVLLRCPFCESDALVMRFDRDRWALDHICTQGGCPWEGEPLPCRVVDNEIFRALPTVVLGTLDKAASVSMQAAMRGLYAAPLGRCASHGFTYAPRSTCPSGCLFPGCSSPPRPLDQDPALYPPTIRMQDELHLLRDSLGAVDAHYEALLDQLQEAAGAQAAKVIASSATLAGHEHQVEVLYRRPGRMFPRPGPQTGRSFWSRDSDKLARQFVGLAPRGVTIEYATDQLCESLQRAVRHAADDPSAVADEIGIDSQAVPGLAWAYGTDVVYGANLKDVEAAARSFESQLQVQPLNPATLTGRTPLADVHSILERLIHPEGDFYERIHVIAASSMLSHGVDIDRLNVMVMLGLPLATAEFIQTTSRVGRKYPGLVVVLHKIGRERDARVYRTFGPFVAHADRLIDPVPITARSRRVLELTFAGLLQGRIYGIHEPAALAVGLHQLTTPASLRKAFAQLPVREDDELEALKQMLGFNGPLDENLRSDLREHLREFYRALNDVASDAKWVSDLFISPPMRSLRDVEEQAPVFSRGGVR